MGYQSEEVNLLVMIYKGTRWLLLKMIGLYQLIIWLIAGVLFSITIVGWEYAKVIFESSIYLFCFTDKELNSTSVDLYFRDEPVANGIWCCTFGAILSVLYAIYALMLCATIIFIPTGIALFKMAKYSIAPFGAYYVSF